MLNVKNQFPIFEAHPELVFLDSAASSQKPACVVDAEKRFYETSYANIHRGLYDLSAASTKAYEEARSVVAGFINAPSPSNIVFTKNATESINLVATCFGSLLQAGDEVIISEAEHHANIVPWQMLGERVGIKLKIAPVSASGELDIQAFKNLLSDNTKLVAITHISNVLGVLNPVEEITELAHKVGAKVLIDGSQGVVHTAVNVTEIDCDFYAFTGHKLYAPTGVGVLYMTDEMLQTLPPYQGGGDMVESVTFDKTTYAKAPAKFEAGTPNIAGVVTLAEAIKFVQNIGMANITAHEAELSKAMCESLSTVDGLKFIGDPQLKHGIFTFNLKSHHPSDVAMLLNEMYIAVRTGHHCAMPLHARFGMSGSVRASLGMYNTLADVEKFTTALVKVNKMLG